MRRQLETGVSGGGSGDTGVVFVFVFVFGFGSTWRDMTVVSRSGPNTNTNTNTTDDGALFGEQIGPKAHEFDDVGRGSGAIDFRMRDESTEKVLHACLAFEVVREQQGLDGRNDRIVGSVQQVDGCDRRAPTAPARVTEGTPRSRPSAAALRRASSHRAR